MKKHLTLGVFILALMLVFAGCRQPSSSEVPVVTGVTVVLVDETPLSTEFEDSEDPSDPEDPADPDDPEIPLVVQRGGTARFAAAVEGMNYPPQTVNWYIFDGNRQSGTRITADGVLYVAVNEPLETLTIGARSTFDTRRFGHVTVYLEGWVPDIVRLETPEITLVGSVIKWDEVPGAGGYSLRIGGIEVYGGSLGRNARSFDLADLSLAEGGHFVTLVALGVPGQSLDSYVSNTITYTITGAIQPGIPQLSAPVITLSGSELSWVAVSDAGGYSLRVGGIEAVGGDLGPGARAFDLADLALSIGDHEITLVAFGIPGQSLNSPESNSVTYTVMGIAQPGLDPLPAPVIELSDLVVSWVQVPNAGGYSLRIGGIERENLGPGETSFDLRNLGLSIGDHVITLVAIGVPGESLNSPVSNAVIATLFPEPLESPVITLDESVVSWDAVPGAGGYSLLVDGTERANLGRNARSFNLADLSLSPGPHVITLVALGIPGQSLDSPESNAETYTVEDDDAKPDLLQLPAPVITRTGSVVSWPMVSGAGGYSLRIDGIEVAGGDLGPGAASFDLIGLNLLAGDHIVTLVALGVPGQSLNSPPSNAITYIVAPGVHPGLPQLDAPMITLVGDSLLSWTAVPNAGGYSLRIGGIERVNFVSGTSFDLADLGLPVGTHIVTLVALGIPGQSLNSPASNAVPFTVLYVQPGLPQLDAPVISLDEAMVLWAPVPGAGGYSLRIDGIERVSLGHTETGFSLAGLGLPVGSHSITLVALGIPGQSLDSPASNAVNFYVIIATGVTVTVTLPDLRDMASGIDIEGPTFGMLGEPGRIIFDREDHDVSLVEWFLGESQVPTGTVSVDETRYTLTLDSRIHSNREGTHHVTLEVIIGGIRYSRVIAFTVKLYYTEE